MSEEMVRVEEKLDQLIKTVDRIDESINGNGRLGLKTETDRNTQAISFLKKVGGIALAALLGLISALALTG